MENNGIEPAGFSVDVARGVVRLSGAWTVRGLGALPERFSALHPPRSGAVTLDANALTALDTGGAWLLQRLLVRWRGTGAEVALEGLRAEHAQLLGLVETRMRGVEPVAPTPRPAPLERLGRTSWGHLLEFFGLLAFIGEVAEAAWASVRRPQRIRWRALLEAVQRGGVDAIPIIGLLSFLLGVVIAYQGAVQLRTYGANLYIVDLVSITMLRELAPMMTAIIVAGRTGSAYTAEIGTMRVTEELDAMRTIGLSPLEVLVLPKLFGLIIALPLLVVWADAAGVFGGMLMANAMLGVDFNTFLTRFPHAVSFTTFVIGVGKAPVFAAIVAGVGCFQGFLVQGGADSVGRQTTVSVVQAIFLVIVTDALFSVFFSWLGI